MKVIGCIPSRYQSSRLPGKPLCEIAGKPLVLHVVEHALQAKTLDDVIVLTDDERIFNTVAEAGYHAAMTSVDCLNGTERLIDYLPHTDADVLVNVQGDELLLNPTHIDQLVTEFCASDANMGTIAHPSSEASVLQDHTNAKVVTDLSQRALYFSRSCIPLQQSGALPEQALVQIGVYIYQRDTLLKLQSLAPSPLEQVEHLEQLRALQNGISVHVSLVDEYESLSIDTPEDLEKAQQNL